MTVKVEFVERKLEDEYQYYKLRVLLQVDAISAGLAIVGFSAGLFSLEAPRPWATVVLHLLPVIGALAVITLSTKRRSVYIRYRKQLLTGFRSMALLFPSFADTLDRVPPLRGPLPLHSLAALLTVGTESVGFLALAIGYSLDMGHHLVLHALLLLRFLRQAPRVCAAPYLSQNPDALRQLAAVARHMQSGLGALPEGVLGQQLPPLASCTTVFVTVATVVALVLTSFSLLLLELSGRRRFLRAAQALPQGQPPLVHAAVRRELVRLAQLDPLVLVLTFMALLPGVVSVVWHTAALVVGRGLDT